MPILEYPFCCKKFLFLSPLPRRTLVFFFFFFNDPATTEISPFSLPAALPICTGALQLPVEPDLITGCGLMLHGPMQVDPVNPDWLSPQILWLAHRKSVNVGGRAPKSEIRKTHPSTPIPPQHPIPPSSLKKKTT